MMNLTASIQENSQEQGFVKPDPFLWANFVEAADELESLFLYGPSVTAVLGADGIGKTRLIEYLQNESENVTLLRINANPLLSVEQLMLMLSEQLLLLEPSENSSQILQHIHNKVKDRPVVFLVDDAHHLSLELTKVLLSFLGEIKQVPDVPIRLFAFLANRFNDTLILDKTGMVDKNALYKLALTGFLHSEITSYLGYQLNLSEESIESNLGEKKLTKLWDASMGNSSKLQQALKQMLIEPKVSVQKKFTLKDFNPNVIFRVGLALLGIAFLAIAFWGTQRSTTNKTQSIEPKVKKVFSETTQNKELQKLDAVASHLDNLSQEQSQDKTMESTAEIDTDTKEQQVDKLLSDINKDQPVISVAAENRTEEVSNEGDKQTSAVELSAKAQDLPSLVEKENQEIQQKSEEQKSESTIEKANTQQLTDTIKIFEMTEDEKWLMEREPRHFTIQIVGLRNHTEMMDYSRPFKKQAPFYIYQRVLNDESWYFLVTGDYSNANLAREALKKLPQELQKAKPWIKTFAVIQGQITRKK